ncbi:flagellar motor protein MotB [Thiovibrio sp. JS02]
MTPTPPTSAPADGQTPAGGPMQESGPGPETTPADAGQEVEFFGLEFDYQNLQNPFSEEAHGKSPAWILTFADMMTLLLCFFILLFTISRVDLAKFREVAMAMTSALGGKNIIYVPVEGGGKEIIGAEEADLTPKLRKTIMDAERLRAALSGEIDRRILDVVVSEQLIIIQILQHGTFEPGRADLHPAFLITARKIRDALVEIPGDITIAGHTDNLPVSGGMFRSNWELAGARAYSVMHELLRGKVLPDDRFVLKGYGATQPRVPNSSEANREKNRRVEIIIDQRGIKDRADLIAMR